VCVWLVAANAPVLHIVELETVEHGDALLGRETKTKQDTIRERENKTIYYHLKSLDGFRPQAFVCAPDLKSRSSLLSKKNPNWVCLQIQIESDLKSRSSLLSEKKNKSSLRTNPNRVYIDPGSRIRKREARENVCSLLYMWPANK
jgi:hypothetical protein